MTRWVSGPLLVIAVLAMGLVLGAPPASAVGDRFVVDLAEDDIRIDLGFDGGELFLFGVAEPGVDIIAVIRGKGRDEVVRRKIRRFGIWTNGPPIRFENVPAFYAIATNRPLDEMKVPAATLAKYRIGARHFGAQLAGAGDIQKAGREKLFAALAAAKRHAGLLTVHPAQVDLRLERLFNVVIPVPANVPVSPYEVEVYMVRSGKVIALQKVALTIDRVGLEAGIYQFSRNQAEWYGIIAILLALISGWGASLLFRGARR